MATREQILAILNQIEMTLARVEQGMDECLVIANRISWQFEAFSQGTTLASRGKIVQCTLH